MSEVRRKARARCRRAISGDEGEVARLIRGLAAELGAESPVTAEYAASYMSTTGPAAPVGATFAAARVAAPFESGVFLAELGGRAVGILAYSIRPGLFHARPCAIIEEVYVEPGSRGAGVGRALVEEAVRFLESRGVAEVSVSTAVDNTRAQSLYESAGLTDRFVLLEKHFAG